ncbi:unnamed protein product [Spirodela intermedia]|uniref:Myb/SANT-like DNA-binding domain-containing protein n=1 Tax=Spirodela intermedia TaxID=51605 RepID=A0A7I8ILU5_SPIIN|nr:unnamed protein product [Spirodela intermedia]CAA6658847.1 unnamed protein product [Spirodela intermedia]
MVVGEGAAPPPRKHGGPGQPWLDQETAFLIDAYEERWYALKRGQLKAHQWEEAPKSGTQCRHKIEKLRQRYRAERQRSVPSRWPFFERMERLEHGPSPISVRPPPPHPPPVAEGHKEEEEEEEEEEDEEGSEGVDGSGEDGAEEEDDEEEEEEKFNGNTRRINGILNEDELLHPKISRSKRGALRELVVTVKRFREGFVRMEMKRMELMREMERDWIQMETRRAEMLVDSQRHLFDTISRAVRSIKKPKHSPTT